MIINNNTKIGAILKHHPAALEAIVSISPKFEKLRNPILRKLMAGRASIAMASKMGGCETADIFAKLAPLGFDIDTIMPTTTDEVQQIPDFIRSLPADQLILLDVRPVIASGNDPLSLILQQIKTIQKGQVLKIINTFEPTPLMLLLQKQGFDSYAAHINEQLVETWFYKTAEWQPAEPTGNWEDAFTKYQDHLQTIDVRHLDMPLPMMTILESLDQLPAQTALFVYHKRIPLFLLPELAQRQLDYRIKEISDDEVHLLIFRD